MEIKIVDLKECREDTEKIESLLNEIRKKLATYEIKSITLTDDRKTAVITLENAEGMGYFNMLTDAADARKNENIPVSSGNTFRSAIAVLLNNANNLVRMFVPEKISDERSRWSSVFEFTLPIYLSGNKKIKFEIISNYPNDKLIQAIKKAHPDKVEVFVSNKKLKFKEEEINGFVVIEPVGYWMESLDTITKGFANFGDTEGTQGLIEFFDKKIKSNTTPLL